MTFDLFADPEPKVARKLASEIGAAVEPHL
jgi:hypothetical protein